MSHNSPLPNSKTFRIYLTFFPLARDVIYKFSFFHNSKMWYTKICCILQLSTTSHHHLQSFIHSYPHSPTHGYFMITSCCMYTLYGWMCMVVEDCVWFWLVFFHVTDIIHWKITILIRFFLYARLYFVRDKCSLLPNIQSIEKYIKNIWSISFLPFPRHNKEHYLCFWIFLSISEAW